MKNFLHFLLGWLVMSMSIPLVGQSHVRATELINKTGGYYSENDYHILLSYVLKTEKGKKLDSYDGFSVKKQGQSYTRIGPVEYIQDSENFLKINNDEKAMLFSKGAEDFGVGVKLLEEMIKGFEKVVVQDEAGHYRIEMEAGAIRQNQYQSVELFINKKDYSFLKQRMVLTKGALGNSTNGEKIILEIKFEGAGNLKEEDYHKLYLGNYLGDVKNGFPVGDYKGYELIDTTKI